MYIYTHTIYTIILELKPRKIQNVSSLKNNYKAEAGQSHV